MFKRILVPLDGSTCSERALSTAARIARASGGTIILLRVTNLKIGYGPYFVLPSPSLEEARKTELAYAKKYLARIAQFGELAGMKTETEAIAGVPADTIPLYTYESQADLIVMCSHGYSGFKRWALGSVAQKVARCSPVPVLVLREAGPHVLDRRADPQHPYRALVALDGSPLAETALVPAAQLISALAVPPTRAELHLMRVLNLRLASPVEEAKEPVHSKREQAVSDASAYLVAITARLNGGPVGKLGVEITWSVTEHVDVANTLIREAELGENNVSFEEYDLIAMATHGRTGLQRWIKGSITERILNGTKLPLLVIPPREQEAQTSRESSEERLLT